jgi:hypothetical protein
LCSRSPTASDRRGHLQTRVLRLGYGTKYGTNAHDALLDAAHRLRARLQRNSEAVPASALKSNSFRQVGRGPRTPPHPSHGYKARALKPKNRNSVLWGHSGIRRQLSD